LFCLHTARSQADLQNSFSPLFPSGFWFLNRLSASKQAFGSKRASDVSAGLQILSRLSTSKQRPADSLVRHSRGASHPEKCPEQVATTRKGEIGPGKAITNKFSNRQDV
jgi:hypothetical protein